MTFILWHPWRANNFLSFSLEAQFISGAVGVLNCRMSDWFHTSIFGFLGRCNVLLGFVWVLFGFFGFPVGFIMFFVCSSVNVLKKQGFCFFLF